MTETETIIETTGALGRIRLNRPKAINASRFTGPTPSTVARAR